MLHAQAVATPPRLIPPLYGKVVEMEVGLQTFGSWGASIKAGAPNTAVASRVWGLGHHFVVPKPAPRTRHFVLMWAGPNTKNSARDGIAWGDLFSLARVGAYDLLALSAVFPRLYTRFGLDGAGLVSTELFTEEDELHVCGLWQSARDGDRFMSAVQYQKRFLDRTIFVFARK